MRGSAVAVLKYEQERREDTVETERWIACSTATGRRIRLKTRVSESLDMTSDTLQQFRVSGRFVAWIGFEGARFGPYRVTVEVQRFGGHRRSFALPRGAGDAYVDTPELDLSSNGVAAVLSRSRYHGDVLRVFDRRGVARRYDEAAVFGLDRVSVAASGTVSWRHSRVERRLGLPAADPCTASPSQRSVVDATLDATIVPDQRSGTARGCLRATGRTVALPGRAVDAATQGSVALAGKYAATVRSVGPLENVVEVTDLGTGLQVGPPFALPRGAELTGPDLPTLQLLADGRLVIMPVNDGKHPLLLRALDGTTTVLDGRDGLANPMLDDGLVIYQDNAAPDLTGRIRIAPARLGR